MKRQAIFAACLGGCILASGCLKLKLPPSAQMESMLPERQAWAKLSAENAGEIQDNWVASFDDARLDALVREALDHNRDLEAASARLDKAMALAKRAGADLWPWLDAQAGGTGGSRSTGRSVGDVRVGLLASWELDVWGRLRYRARAAAADVFVAAADLEFARQSIAASVAESYYLVIANKLRLGNANHQLAIQEDIDRIQQAKVKAGQVGRFESELSRSDLARFSADVQERQAKFEESVRALEVLLGRFPAAELNSADALPAPQGHVPAGLPSELLERRPDIIAAEQSVASAFYETQSARMNLLPRIALTADGGFASTRLFDLLDRHNAAFSVGGNLFQPLFDAGLRFAEIEESRAEQRLALAQYAQTALNAFLEVQNGLANEAYFRQRESELKRASEAMEVVLPLARQRYRAGELSLLNFKQVQTQAYDTDDDYIASQFATIQQRIRLHLALGGSILPAPTTQPAGN